MDKYIELLFEGEFDKADRLRKSAVPDKLYKFVSLTDNAALNEDKFKCLEEKKFFFSAVNNENDPYEFKGIYLAEADFVELGWSEEKAKNFLSEFDPSLWFSIACLTGNDENCLPMWAYYTNDYKGYCIEYNVDDPSQIYKVIYDGRRVPGAYAVSRLLSAKEAENEREANYVETLLKMALYLKHLSWDWENEFRIFTQLPDKNAYGTTVELSRIGLSTKRVIAGLNCTPEHLKRLRDICKKNSFAFSKAAISKNSFGFEDEL